jgi:hypothetical protein
LVKGGSQLQVIPRPAIVLHNIVSHVKPSLSVVGPACFSTTGPLCFPHHIDAVLHEFTSHRLVVNVYIRIITIFL